MTATKKALYRVRNEFHNFTKDTASDNPKTVARIVRESKPSDCKSYTYIYKLDDAGEIACRVDLVNGELREIS